MDIDLESLNKTPQDCESPVKATLARRQRALVADNAGGGKDLKI